MFFHLNYLLKNKFKTYKFEIFYYFNFGKEKMTHLRSLQIMKIEVGVSITRLYINCNPQNWRTKIDGWMDGWVQ